MTAAYRFTLRRGEEPNTVVGTLVDTFGWVITVHGTLDPETREYVGEGHVGEVPDAFRIELHDRPKKAEAAE